MCVRVCARAHTSGAFRRRRCGRGGWSSLVVESAKGQEEPPLPPSSYPRQILLPFSFEHASHMQHQRLRKPSHTAGGIVIVWTRLVESGLRRKAFVASAE